MVRYGDKCVGLEIKGWTFTTRDTRRCDVLCVLRLMKQISSPDSRAWRAEASISHVSWGPVTKSRKSWCTNGFVSWLRVQQRRFKGHVYRGGGRKHV